MRYHRKIKNPPMEWQFDNRWDYEAACAEYQAYLKGVAEWDADAYDRARDEAMTGDGGVD